MKRVAREVKMRVRKPSKITSINLDLDLYEAATELAAANMVKKAKEEKYQLVTVSKVVNQALREYLTKLKKLS